ncbi:MAG: hypothetical protein WAN65_00995 [Candidatus Sulfotelmatobacter sp.]
MATRAEVYGAIDSERAYQDVKWGANHTHGVAEYVTYMHEYLAELRKQMTRNAPGTPDYVAGLDTLRKVAGLAVAAMEQNGAPRRAGY